MSPTACRAGRFPGALLSGVSICKPRSVSDPGAFLSAYCESADSSYAKNRGTRAAESCILRARNRLPFLPTTRRKFIRVAAPAGVAALAADTILIEPNRPRIVRQEIALRRWPARLEGFTIALL